MSLTELLMKEMTIYLVCLLAVAACAYTINSAGQYQDRINQHWIEQWERSGCALAYQQANLSVQWGDILFYEALDEDTNISDNP